MHIWKVTYVFMMRFINKLLLLVNHFPPPPLFNHSAMALLLTVAGSVC